MWCVCIIYYIGLLCEQLSNPTRRSSELEIDGHITQIMAKFIQDTKKNDHFILKFDQLHSVEPSVGYLSAASAIGMRAQFSFFTLDRKSTRLNSSHVKI